MDAFDAIASSAVLDYDGMQIVLALFGQLSTNQWFMPNPVTLATKSDIPSALPNPEYLTFKPGTNTLFSELVPISYSGESAQIVYLPTKTSHLENDSGFLTAAPVTSVNGQTGAVQITIPAALKNPSALTINGSGTAENNLLSTFYTMETLGDDYFRLVPVDAGGGKWKAQANVASVTDAEFFRISLAGSGENLIVTVDEPID